MKGILSAKGGAARFRAVGALEMFFFRAAATVFSMTKSCDTLNICLFLFSVNAQKLPAAP
jgi:hypothetical protein